MHEGLSLPEIWDLVEAIWRQQDHPRGPDGKFRSKGGQPSGAPSAKRTTGSKSRATKKTSAPPKPPPAKNAKFVADHYSPWRDSLTPAQRNAISSYQGADYELMNGQLRGRRKNNVNADNADLTRAARANRQLSDAIRAAPPLDEPMTVYRTMSADQAAGLQAGVTMGDKGFVSASLTPRGAHGEATVEVALPAGTRAAVGDGEEMILPASGRFRVLSVEDRGGTPHVRMEFVPRASPKPKSSSAAKPKKAKPAKQSSDAPGMQQGLRHTSNEAGLDWAFDKLPMPDTLTPDQRTTIYQYTQNGYELVNEGLRGKPVADKDLDRYRQHVDNLDASIGQSRTPESVLVHRVIGPRWARSLGADPENAATMKDLVGKVYVEPGYMSTSAGKGPDTADAVDMHLKVRVPAGYPALNVMPLSEFGRSEREILLRRDARYVVHTAYQRGTVWFVELEVVPDGWNPPPGWAPDPYGDGGEAYKKEKTR